ncbi:MAG: M28 family peptidase [Saprospiraceae bacterium]|nr:MAG: peptidase M28 [Bacteroidetes bacterium OLB9]MCO6463185.1 M28 family peptidase [Saprospiraceae bacterium]
MRKFLFLAIIVLFGATNSSDKGLLKVFTAINEDVMQNGRAYETLGDAIDKIGHRLTGSENGAKAEQYALDLLRSYGYSDAKFQQFSVEAWSRNKVSLQVEMRDKTKDVAARFQYKVVSLAHSPVSAHVTAEIIDVGDGLNEDFEAAGEAVKDKIALVNINIQSPENKGKRNLHRSEKTALAIQYGAKGIIIANSVPGGVLLTGTASVTGSLIPIPAVCISLESGQGIRRLIAENGRLIGNIDMSNFSKPITARNVIATLPGTDKKLSKEKIIIGGHLDSWDLATGAIDNGIGSFSIMDIARVFKNLNLKTKQTIEFVLFMGEEQGLLGSQHMVKEYEKTGELDKVRLMINLDMTNNTSSFNAGGNEDLSALMTKIGTTIRKIDTTYTNINRNWVGLHSDHQPFMLSGVQVASPIGKLPSKAYGCYHADCDHFDLVSKDDLNNNVRFTAMMLYALANEKRLPTQRMSSNATRDFLIKHNLKNELILGNAWKWEK